MLHPQLPRLLQQLVIMPPMAMTQHLHWCSSW
jgi:hypothetical protein